MERRDGGEQEMVEVSVLLPGVNDGALVECDVEPRLVKFRAPGRYRLVGPAGPNADSASALPPATHIHSRPPPAAPWPAQSVPLSCEVDPETLSIVFVRKSALLKATLLVRPEDPFTFTATAPPAAPLAEAEPEAAPPSPQPAQADSSGRGDGGGGGSDDPELWASGKRKANREAAERAAGDGFLAAEAGDSARAVRSLPAASAQLVQGGSAAVAVGPRYVVMLRCCPSNHCSPMHPPHTHTGRAPGEGVPAGTKQQRIRGGPENRPGRRGERCPLAWASLSGAAQPGRAGSAYGWPPPRAG